MAEYQIQRKLTGGVRLIAHKSSSTATPINTDLMPERLIIPMTQHPGRPATPTVAVGQKVRRGQVVGEPRETLSTASHAPRSGEVLAVEERLVPSGSGLVKSPCILIEVDDDFTDSRAETLIHWPDEHAERILTIRAAGIVGLGGAAFPTAEKLGSNKSCSTLILNGAECEPYISCDDMLMREHAIEILAGTQTMMSLLGAELCLLAIERDKPLALESMTAAVADLGDERFRIAVVPTVYPAGGERQLLELLTGEEVPSGNYPVVIGTVCQNVATAYALDRLVREGEPLTTRIVTVTGMGVKEPQNVEVPIGTPIRELIRHCGGYADDVARLIHGGSMMGYAVSSDELPVTKATNCVIAARKDEIRDRYEEWPCIRCGDCADVCPVRLLPQDLLRLSKSSNFRQLDVMGLSDCIECGCCDVVCPSQIPLTEYFRNAKYAREVHERRERLASTSQTRYLSKQERLGLKKEQTEKRHMDLKAQVASDSGSRQKTIQDAIDRAQRRHDAKDETT